MHSSTVTCVMLMCAVSFVEVLSNDELQCYKCTNVKLENSNPLLKNLLPGQTQKWCEHPSVSDTTETCPSATDYMCSFFEGSISFALVSSALGDYRVTVQKRGCMKVDSNSRINQCKPVGSKNERKFVGTVLSLLTEMARNVKIDGKICVCGTDLCDANCKGVAIGPVCLSLPVAIVLGIVSGILALLIVTCCCCCCCTCCKSRRPQFISVGLPVFTTVTLPQASAMGAVSPYSHLQEEEPVIQ
ncbi:hypothetical protein NP493_467g02021 [Ridgeia piscesae]|uniref:Uncharacterized protein n=1 Tax=Ridgeia piscesae TaxID=27915 RepID=A0AAD9KYV3_RIDPI|nr:hypothetical protein NP493_467g02021 [Ridgeia piscesae]